jgi:hypothetical protein
MKVTKKETKKMVKAPEGYHWMTKGGRYFLMAHKGELTPHEGASLEMPFRVLSGH